MTQEELDNILEKHRIWLAGGEGGEIADLKREFLPRADFHGANLSKADLRGANLYGANLRGVNLSEASLCQAILSGADLFDANLREAGLCEADFFDANLREADLCGANLRGADLRGADLYEANLSEADLRGANLSKTNVIRTIFDEKERYRKGVILKKYMTGYKRCGYNKIVTLKIPKGAIVYCINGSKCRTNHAIVKEISDGDEAISVYCPEFKYRIGDNIEIEDFDLNPSVECGTGIHFFKTRKEAEEYTDF